MNILVISHMYPNPVNPMSGIFVHNQVKALVALGANVRIVSPIPSFPFYPKWKGYTQIPRQTVIDGIPVDYVSTRMFPGGYFFSFYGQFYIKSLKKVIAQIQKEFQFDLIHCHTIFPDGFAGAAFKQQFQVPVISTIHGSDLLLYPKRSRAIYIKTCQALQQNDLIITVSKRLLEEAKKMIPDIEGKTIYNGFNPNQFAPMDQKVAREQLGLSINGKQLLFVGNLLPVKGVNYLLDAFAQVAAHVPEVYLHLVGDGPLRSTLEQQVEKLKLKERVSFKGRRPYEEIPMWVNSADAVVLSSLSEGLPSILLETMGCGKPMIATDVGGIAEILQHGKTGFLVPSKQVKELSESMLTILQEEGLGIQMGTNALEASKELTWQQNAVNILQIYKDVSNRKSL